MMGTRIKDEIKEFVNNINIEGTPFFEDGKDNTAVLNEVNNTVSIDINDNSTLLFEYTTTDELKEFFSWEVYENIIKNEDNLKCFITNGQNIVNKTLYCEHDDQLCYKIIVNQTEILENWELFCGNIEKFLDINSIKDTQIDLFKIFSNAIKERGLCVLEISNINVVIDNLKNQIEKNPSEFVRTNLIIINNKLKSLLELYDFEKDDLDIPTEFSEVPVSLLPYSFYPELLCFLENAQNMNLNHIKFIDYYHVLEYFITDFAFKKLDDSLRNLISLYLEGGNYEELRRVLLNISENNNIINLGKDEPLLDVLLQIDFNFIINTINDNNLYNMLDREIYDIPQSQLLLPKWVKRSDVGIKKVISKNIDESEFYKRLYKRIYKIRNILIHSKARFRGTTKMDFLPTEEYENQLEEDIILIREIAIKLCKKQCVNQKSNS